MGSFNLIITDYAENTCDVKNCSNVDNQIQVIITKHNAKIERYCWKHFHLFTKVQK